MTDRRWSIAWMVAVATIVSSASTGAASQAPRNCKPYAIYVGWLAVQFGEYLRAEGIASDGKRFRFFVNPKTRRWTKLYMPLPGYACVVGHGTGWRTRRTNKASIGK